ncbi:unnamed protein product [Rotaria socialis]
MTSKKSAASSTAKKNLMGNKQKPLESGPLTNLEAFACLWLDANIKNTKDNCETEQELRRIINHLRTFDQENDCEKLIRATKNEKIILIVSGQLGRSIVPRLHHLTQLVACYVYCLNGTDHEEWTKNYAKVRGVYVLRKELLQTIAQEQKSRLEAETLSAIAVVSGDSAALESRNAMFLWFQIFIEVLIRMHHHVDSKQELIQICKRNYKSNPEEFRVIEEFEKSYKPEGAILWYTRECCFYRILNKALRIHDFNTLFILRFFITDISKVLNKLQAFELRMMPTRDKFIVYRGQIMNRNEFDLMKTSIGNYISMNSFLSTSRQRDVAVWFLNNAEYNEDTLRVIFEISIYPQEKTKAYADISKCSRHEMEEEILIMLGALFLIRSIDEDFDNNIWIVRLVLASEDDFKLKDTLVYMKEKIGEETNLGTLGEILIQMGEYDQALKYSSRMMYEAKMGTAKAFEIEAKAACLKGDYTRAFNRSDNIMTIYNEILPPVCAEKGRLHCAVGAVYYQQNKYDKALSKLNEALHIQQQVLPSNHPDICETYQRLADCYESMGKIAKALEYYSKCLNIRLVTLPDSHPDLALTYNNLGSLYDNNKNYEQAFDYYQKSVTISRKTLPPTHPETQRTEMNIEKLKQLIYFD